MTNIDRSKEPVIVVDKDDNQIEVSPRTESENNPAKIIRFVYVLLFNQEGQILIQRRHADLERFPNYWTASASGAVFPEESYPQAAERKVQDELGVSPKLFHQTRIRLGVPEKADRMTGVFVGYVDDITQISPNEIKVSEVRWVTTEEAEKGYLLAPSFAQLLQWWKQSEEDVKKEVKSQLES